MRVYVCVRVLMQVPLFCPFAYPCACVFFPAFYFIVLAVSNFRIVIIDLSTKVTERSQFHSS